MYSLEYYTRQKTSWKHDEVQQISNEYESLQKNISEIADIHKRTPGSISYKLKSMGIINDNKLSRGYEEYRNSELYAEIVGSSKFNITSKNSSKKYSENQTQVELEKIKIDIQEIKENVNLILKHFNIETKEMKDIRDFFTYDVPVVVPEGYLHVKGKQKAEPYLLQFDGASDPNPGPSAGGAVLFHPGTTDPVFERYEFIPHATNNEAEYNGLIIGLQEAADAGIKNLLIEGDSNLIINQFAGTWKIKAQNLVSLHKKARDLLSSFDFVAIKHIPREKNTHADRLTNEGVKEKDSVLRLFES
jgi:ribonuclease HI